MAVIGISKWHGLSLRNSKCPSETLWGVSCCLDQREITTDTKKSQADLPCFSTWVDAFCFLCLPYGQCEVGSLCRTWVFPPASSHYQCLVQLQWGACHVLCESFLALAPQSHRGPSIEAAVALKLAMLHNWSTYLIIIAWYSHDLCHVNDVC